MERLRRSMLAGGFIAYPVLVHVLVIWDNPGAALLLMVGASLVLALFYAWQHRSSSARLGAVLYGSLAAIGLASMVAGRVDALFLPQILINLALALVFGGTLRAGAIPLIRRFMHMQLGDTLPAGMQEFARRLTRLWTGFFILMALTGAGLAVFAPLEVWSTFANVVNYLLVVAFFIGQFVYGHARYRFQNRRDTLAFALRLFRHGPAGLGGAPTRPVAGSGK
jgi:uncharacterized membrane protein